MNLRLMKRRPICQEGNCRVKASGVNIDKSVQAISVYLVHRLSKEENCSCEDTLKGLPKTMTYELL